MLRPFRMNFEGVEHIHVICVQLIAFGDTQFSWWTFEHDFYMLTGLWQSRDKNYGCLYWFCGLHSWSWFKYVIGLWWTKFQNFGWIYWFEDARNINVLLPPNRALENTGGSWFGFIILIMISIWSFMFDIPIFQILTFCM